VKYVRVFTGPDLESHIEQQEFEFDSDTLRTAPQFAKNIQFAERRVGFRGFHTPRQRQYMLYLTARVELGLGDGTSVMMNPGDVLLAEDLTGRGHSSRVLEAGLCAVVALKDEAAEGSI
jgi:hypothetical protein